MVTPPNCFTEKLRHVQKATSSLLCIGLDSEIQKLPSFLHSEKDPILEFNRRIIDATYDLVCAYKPNLAFYESLGDHGPATLRETLFCIPKSIITIGDGKRGDIGNTSEHYASSLLDYFGFDAVTINPYLGFDSVEPYLRNPEKGVFLLALTSNPGSRDFQRLKIRGIPLYEKVVRKAKLWNTNSNIGLVVGATHPRELKSIRKIVPEMPLLIPGVGTQGGNLELSIKYGVGISMKPVIINVSRSILYASSGADFAEAARAEAKKLREKINQVLESMTS